MSTEDSWSCLTVQHFLRSCNWEGKLPEIHNLPPEKSHQNSWQTQVVQDFFNEFNWSGEQLEQPRHSCSESINLLVRQNAYTCAQTSLKRLLVKEFFNQCNWQGRSLEAYRIWEQLDPYARLKQPVREFFQFISWEGEPEIGKLPSSATTFFQPTVAPQPKLSDLTDLF